MPPSDRETLCNDSECPLVTHQSHIQGSPGCRWEKPPADTGDRDYYREGSIECIDAIKAALGGPGFISFLRGQVIKYNWRLASKGNASEDSIKALWYQTRLKKELEDEVHASSRPVEATDCFKPGEPATQLGFQQAACIKCQRPLGYAHKADCPRLQNPSDPG